jgi:Rieske Fe-S protein
MTHAPPSPDLLADQPRRGFFASFLAIVIGGVVGLVPLVAGTLFFLDPLLRRKDKPEETSGDEGFVKLNITLDELKASQVPIQVPIISSRIDKWNRYPLQAIGSAYLQLAEDGKTVMAFNVTCPHLGCAVEYRETPEDKTPEYYCPCHNSAFSLDGKKKNVIPPRDLDSLEVQVKKNDQNVDEIWVKYQDFRATLAEKVPV